MFKVNLVNLENNSHLVLVFLLLTLIMQMPTGDYQVNISECDNPVTKKFLK